ncbi:hypothetical protein NM688_g9059 [Phlebia brevispora]|uniref:Uncharacterized protein n=1 Tax=Phlebia brevispora TaxID=194682 RepID=A0ACC1RL88_9APHY|nr:hypothetical protein NM688_g9059 [Phlebia brevispora]
MQVRAQDEAVVGAVRIKHLSLGAGDLDIELLPAWTRAIGASLEHLSLSFAQVGGVEITRKASACLQHCPELRQLTLCATRTAASASGSCKPISVNPYFWSCALEVFRAALLHAQALECIEFICVDGETHKEYRNAVESVEKLLTEVNKGDTYGREIKASFLCQ